MGQHFLRTHLPAEPRTEHHCVAVVSFPCLMLPFAARVATRDLIMPRVRCFMRNAAGSPFGLCSMIRHMIQNVRAVLVACEVGSETGSTVIGVMSWGACSAFDPPRMTVRTNVLKPYVSNATRRLPLLRRRDFMGSAEREDQRIRWTDCGLTAPLPSIRRNRCAVSL